ncbi:uncharacterized protein BCR38DRAFT_421786 [Pseudomassariella vexata]|uniref:DUF952 domain protein n=1 Tax=Pseudomassariella vexata TaxID=1141098 RepID=A0A1Y2EFZ2_9PEZI|nr:uncharacterized protein BCR38DRAFT_421786 [Pseudomassariella vexata]ORY70337.1 hypothetical protein BCR38DRAFT_421786 [Pseudomassariella vexata]
MSSSTPAQAANPSNENTTAQSRFIYKIAPASLVPWGDDDTILELSHHLPSSALDQRDGFLHMSTSLQVPKTLGRFFGTSALSRDVIYLIKIDYEKLKAQTDLQVKWESPDGRRGEPWEGGLFPHIYLGVSSAKTDGKNGDGLAVLGGKAVGGDGVVPVHAVVKLVSEMGAESWDEATSGVQEWLV